MAAVQAAIAKAQQESEAKRAELQKAVPPPLAAASKPGPAIAPSAAPTPSLSATPTPSLSAASPPNPSVSVTPAPPSRPAPAPATAGATAAVIGVDSVQRAVVAWAAAWSSRNVESYLDMYAPEFRPAEGASYDAWKKQRTERIGKARIIEVGIDNIQVNLRDDRHATTTFSQLYRSDGYRDEVEKRLELERRGERWLIVGESVIRILKTDEALKRAQPN